MVVKKIKLEAMSNYHPNNNQHAAESENGDLNSAVAIENATGRLNKIAITYLALGMGEGTRTTNNNPKKLFKHEGKGEKGNLRCLVQLSLINGEVKSSELFVF
uniref:Uncharacterized protein n=1 Tax=Micrurus lemniscatus lemniscatus TaxID=129467 RepID=A0A2D4JKL7_MICLE